MNTRVPPIPTIEEVDLSQPLDGSEGLSANYISRIRTQYLFSQHQALITQVQFADAKAIALVTLMGFTLLRGPAPFTAVELADPVHLIFLAVGAAAMLFCLLAVVPRYPPRNVRLDMAGRDRWSWPALASDPDQGAEFARFMKTAEVSQLVQSVALSNAAVSRILIAKYAMLRTGFLLAIASLGVLAVHMLRGG